jgi:hypothetical protein
LLCFAVLCFALLCFAYAPMPHRSVHGHLRFESSAVGLWLHCLLGKMSPSKKSQRMLLQRLSSDSEVPVSDGAKAKAKAKAKGETKAGCTPH